MGFNVCGAIPMSIGSTSAMDSGLMAQSGWVMLVATRGDKTISQVK
jgi:hypothetical protein